MKKFIVWPMMLKIVMSLLIVFAAAPLFVAAASGLTWPKSMGTHLAVNIDHENSCSAPSQCDFVGVFTFPNVAIGKSKLSMQQINGLRVLKVDGIDSTLNNGVMQLLPETTVMHTYLMLPNFSLSQKGATLKTTQFGIVNGKANQEFSTLWVINEGNHLKLNGDWSLVGAKSYEIQIYQGRNLVTAQKGLKTGEMFLPVVDLVGEDCEIKPPHRITGELPRAAAFTIPGRGTFTGDNFAILPEHDTGEATAQTRIVMLAKDTGPLYMVEQYAAGGPQVDKQ